MLKYVLAFLSLLLASIVNAQRVDVSESSGGFTRSGPSAYWREAALGDGNHMFYTWTSDAAHGEGNVGTWRTSLPQAGVWRISAFIPRNYADTKRARYQISTADGEQSRILDQSPYFDQWVTLGEYRMSAGGASVRLGDQTNEGWGAKRIGFDTMRWELMRADVVEGPHVCVDAAGIESGKTVFVKLGIKSPNHDPVNYRVELTFPGRLNPVSLQGTFFSDETSYERVVKANLEWTGVPRFKWNIIAPIYATVWNSNGSDAQSKSLEIVLPVILVPGFAFSPDHLRGGDGTFPDLEKFLADQTQKSESADFIVGYRSRNATSDYPTLATLTYGRDTDSLRTAGRSLADLVNVLKANTWAEKVQIVGHSKGGLVGRAYLEFSSGGPSTYRLIMVNSPHTGTLISTLGPQYVAQIAKLFKIPFPDLLAAAAEHAIGLNATYAWYKKLSGYVREEPSSQIDELNGVVLPQGPQYNILYSDAWSLTPAFAVWPSKLNVRFSSGDEIVTTLSQQGYLTTINGTKGELVYAMQGRTIERYGLAGTHGDAMVDSVHMSIIFQRLYHASRQNTGN